MSCLAGALMLEALRSLASAWLSRKKNRSEVKDFGGATLQTSRLRLAQGPSPMTKTSCSNVRALGTTSGAMHGSWYDVSLFHEKGLKPKKLQWLSNMGFISFMNVYELGPQTMFLHFPTFTRSVLLQHSPMVQKQEGEPGGQICWPPKYWCRVTCIWPSIMVSQKKTR